MNVSPQMFTKEEQNKLQKTGAHKWAGSRSVWLCYPLGPP